MIVIIVAAVTAVIVSVICNKSIVSYTFKVLQRSAKDIEDYADQVIEMLKEYIERKK